MSPTRTGLALVGFLLACSAAVAAPELRLYPSGQVISQHQLPEAICRGWVEVHTASASQVVFWDILLEVERDSRLLLGCNPDYIYALTLSGGFDNGLQRLTSGMASLWPHFGGNGDSPTTYDFSAGTLVKLFAVAGQPTDAGLVALASMQDTGTGSLPGNAETLIPAPAGRPFRIFPEIMAIKRASRHMTDYGIRTATQFANALSQKDATLIAALLAPSLFEEGSSAPNPLIKPSPARVAFAERLLALNDYSPMESSFGVRELGNLQYEMRSERQLYRVTLQEAEGCLYVKRLDPEP